MEKRKLRPHEIKFVESLHSKIGDRVKLNGPVSSQLSFFKTREQDKQLVEGQSYTIAFIDPASSWTAVYFEEIPDVWFNFHWFMKSEN